MRTGWIVILLLIHFPLQAQAVDSSTSFSVFPSSYNLGYIPDNFTGYQSISGSFNVTNLDTESPLTLKVSVSNVPEGAFLSIVSTAIVPARTKTPVNFTLEIPPSAGRYVITVRMSPDVPDEHGGSRAVPVFEGKISYIVGGSRIKGFTVESHSSTVPFSASVLMENANPFDTTARFELEVFDDTNTSVYYSDSGTFVLPAMNISSSSVVEMATTLQFDLAATGRLGAVLTTVFENTSYSYLKQQVVHGFFISGHSAPFIETSIQSAEESGKDYAVASVKASNSGELPFTLAVTFIITDSKGVVVNSYSVAEQVETSLQILQPLIFEEGGDYNVTIYGTAGESKFLNQRWLSIGGYGSTDQGANPGDIASQVITSDEVPIRLLVYLILVLIALVLLGLLALIVKKLTGSGDRAVPVLPAIGRAGGIESQVVATMEHAMGSSPSTVRAPPVVPTSEVKLSKLHIFLTSGEALVTYDFRTKRLSDLTEISLTEIIYSMEKLNMSILKFIPLRKNDELTIYIHVVGNIGFGVELADPSKYQELQGASNLVRSLERFHMLYGEQLSMGLVDLSPDDFRKSFRF